LHQLVQFLDLLMQSPELNGADCVRQWEAWG